MNIASKHNLPLPLLRATALNTLFCTTQNRNISRQRLLADVLKLAHLLPDYRYVINLCEDRYHFTVSFLAALITNQVTLLPPNRQPQVIADVAADYLDHYYLADREQTPLKPVHVVRLETETEPKHKVYPIPTLDHQQLACIAFTSGSTGKAKANEKSWGQLCSGTDIALQRFGLNRNPVHHIVTTVPPQHMYGLECSVLYPLLGQVAIFSGRPFFPEDIRTALASLPSPRALITTPIHLRACIKTGLEWPDIAFVISATAPLRTDLARQAEKQLSTSIVEIYGFTETGAVASRHTLDGSRWQLYDGMQFDFSNNTQIHIIGPQLPTPMPVQDLIKPISVTEFELLGRQTDQINIAGKRTSLSDLNHKLTAIPGVEDGVVFMPEESKADTVTRLSAFVVAPELEIQQIQNALAAQIDVVFLPRPLLKVERLPRNETGKLPRTELIALFDRLKSEKNAN
jgi:acyl-coenzyme A synthetase/AMP-(fatty) acid ligase